MEKNELDAWQLLEKECSEIAESISSSIDRLFDTVKLDERTK